VQQLLPQIGFPATICGHFARASLPPKQLQAPGLSKHRKSQD